MIRLKLSADNSEDVDYNFNDFPIEARRALLSDYPNMCASNHWHNDFEFLIILDGKMSFSVNGTSYFLRAGQGIFINSKQMHYGYSNDGSECDFLFVIIHPSLFSDIDRIKENYLLPICDDKSHQLFIFDSSIIWQKRLIDIIIKIYNLCENQSEDFELDIMSNVFLLLKILHRNILNDTEHLNVYLNHNIDILHNMIGYIQNNYHNKITLSDIALSGNICRSACCEIFKSILNKSPISYLTDYRIEKSLDFLNIPSYSITDVALKCGFSNSSYYTEIFRKTLGCTPSQYRKNHSIKNEMLQK